MGKFGNFMNSTTGGMATGGIMDGIGSLFTIGAQKRAATTAYKRQTDFWNKQNAYNTPKAQMERLKAAGLNPALMYGQGNVGNAQNLSGVSKADVQGPSLAQSTATGAQISLLNAQRNKLNAETRNIDAGTTLSTEQAKKAVAETLNIGSQQAKTIQETLNLKTQKEILEVDKALKDLEQARGKKGTIKGDTIGNFLEILNLDPVNNSEDRTMMQVALTAYFGSKVAKDIMSGIGALKGKAINNTIGKQIQHFRKSGR